MIDYRAQAEAFAEYLLSSPKGRIRRVGDDIRGRCVKPDHSDKNPSFSYNIPMDAWVCSCGGGKGSDLRQQLGWAWAGAGDNGNGGGTGLPAPSSRARTLVARYVYEDEQGRPLFRVNKYSPKRPCGFDQERWDEAQQKWIGGAGALEGVPRVLYRLPDLIMLDEKTPILIVEGEKDAETAWELGFPATTSPHGAGHWKDEYAEVFIGRPGLPIILPDADEQGERHVDQIVKCFTEKGIKHKVIKLPAPAKDLTEWVEAGGTKEQLEKILHAPPDFKKITGAAIQLAEEFLPHVEETVDYVLDPLATISCLTQLHGEPKSGKSCVAAYLAICAAKGVNPGGEEIETVSKAGCPVLFVTFEDGPRRLKRRIIDYMAGLGFGDCYPPNFHLWFKPDIDIGVAGGVATMMQALESTKARILVLDTISHMHRADENDASQMKIVMANLAKIARDANCAIMYLHHSAKATEGKSDIYRGRGSSAIVAAADVVLNWNNPVDDVTKCGFVSKDDESRSWMFHYIRTNDGVRWEIKPEEESKKTRNRMDCKKSTLESMKSIALSGTVEASGGSIAKIMADQGFSRSSTYKALAALVEEKQVSATPSGNGKATMYRVQIHV